jgi:hypothetical protein
MRISKRMAKVFDILYLADFVVLREFGVPELREAADSRFEVQLKFLRELDEKTRQGFITTPIHRDYAAFYVAGILNNIGMVLPPDGPFILVLQPWSRLALLVLLNKLPLLKLLYQLLPVLMFLKQLLLLLLQPLLVMSHLHLTTKHYYYSLLLKPQPHHQLKTLLLLKHLPNQLQPPPHAHEPQQQAPAATAETPALPPRQQHQ